MARRVLARRADDQGAACSDTPTAASFDAPVPPTAVAAAARPEGRPWLPVEASFRDPLLALSTFQYLWPQAEILAERAHRLFAVINSGGLVGACGVVAVCYC